MPKKATPRLQIAPLQRIVAEPITDPAEQAALDQLREREKRKQREVDAEISIDCSLDDIDRWKFELHEKLKRMTSAQRHVFWQGVSEAARAEGLSLESYRKPAKRSTKRAKPTG